MERKYVRNLHDEIGLEIQVCIHNILPHNVYMEKS